MLHKRDRSPATVNRELQVLSKVFSMAYDNRLVETDGRYVIVGSHDFEITSRYTHAMPPNLRTAVDFLNKQPLPFRPRSAPRSRQVATGTDGN